MRQQSKEKGPCTKCGKLITQGYGSWLSGVWVCEACLRANPTLVRRLDPETRKKLGL